MKVLETALIGGVALEVLLCLSAYVATRNVRYMFALAVMLAGWLPCIGLLLLRGW